MNIYRFIKHLVQDFQRNRLPLPDDVSKLFGDFMLNNLFCFLNQVVAHRENTGISVAISVQSFFDFCDPIFLMLAQVL